MRSTFKIRLHLILLLAVVAIPSACRYNFQPGEKGSGVRQTQKREVSAFTSISTEGAFEIEVVCQKEPTLEIEGDDNILPLVSTEVRNNVLHLRPIQNYSIDDSIVVRITVPDLDSISASGAGKINVSALKNEKFELDVSGAPKISVTGETGTLKIEATGAAEIDTDKLRVAQAEVEANGVSKIELYVTDRLDVTISGPSRVIYRGEPEVNQTINGPGILEKRESEGA